MRAFLCVEQSPVTCRHSFAECKALRATQIIGCPRRSVSLQVVRRSAHDHFARRETPHHKTLVAQASDTDRHVNAGIDEIDITIFKLYFHIHFGMIVQIASDDRTQMHRAKSDGGRNAQHASRSDL